MAPTSERTGPTKKSLRIWVRNNGHVMRKQTRVTFSYPRTVEAAQDPFECPTGKNKMFYLIAINLFPDQKIVKPDESDSEPELEETNRVGSGSNIEEPKLEPKPSKKRKRAMKSPPAEPVPDPLPEHEETQHSCSSEAKETPANVIETKTRRKAAKSVATTKSSLCQRQRPVKSLKKTGLKTSAANLENKNRLSSKVSDCENCLSDPESADKPSPKKGSEVEVAPKPAQVFNARKLPAIPTIMSSLNKIIETCSATGAVSFSLTKKKPRQSRS